MDTIITLRKGATKADIEKALARLDKKKRVSLKKYSGALKRGLDGLTYQKEVSVKIDFLSGTGPISLI